ncbi:hypothetical protein AGMMS50256_25210 [Betaproteobacteria bacterium]|nr:hypothetical protein AGMMS50256_25210 [Betaproteobacteria bacterium]
MSRVRIGLPASAQTLLERGKAWTGETLQDTAKGAQRLAGGVAEAASAAKRRALNLWQRKSDDPEEVAAIETDKKMQLLRLIDELEKHPRDRLRLLGDVGIGATGALACGAAASALGTTVTTTSIPVVTVTAALFGKTVVGVTVATTPVGWVIGAGVAGAVAAYGISRLIHGGGKSEARMEYLRQSYAKQVKEMAARERQAQITESDKTQIIVAMRPLIEQNQLAADSARRLMAAVESGKMPISRAYRHLAALAGDEIPPDASEKLP